jgi:hypothetical protein
MQDTYELLFAGCTATGTTTTTVTCSIASILVGGSSQLPIVVRPTAAGPFTTSATVAAPGEQNTANNGPANATITVVRTCAVFNGDGSSFPCGTSATPNTANNQSTNPSTAVCCVSLISEQKLAAACSQD